MVGVWLIVLTSSSTTPYRKVPRLIRKKTRRLTQAVVVSEGIFCAARCCVIFHHTEREGLSTHTCSTGMFSRTFYGQHSVTKNLHISPRFSPTIFYQDANSVLLLAHFCTAVLLGSIRKTLCLKLFMMRA